MKKLTALALALTVAFAPVSVAEEQAGHSAQSANERFGAPGEFHAKLDPLIGDWAVEMLVYPAPGMDPIVSTDLTASREWILAGRFVQEKLIGTFAGYPSERLAILGYNNLEARYELATFDTFEPGFMIYTGTAGLEDAAFSMFGDSTEAGPMPEPTGRKRTLRFEFELTETGSVQRIFVTYPGYDEFLFVEQRFTPLEEE